MLAALIVAPAAAHTPPQVFLRQLDVSDQPTGSWTPLAGARVASVNGYELGVRLETRSEHVLVQLTSQPGHFAQANIYGLCFEQAGAPGTIHDVDERIHYAGNGSYGVKVTVSDSPDASTACTTANAASSTGTFSVRGKISMRRVGLTPLVLDPLSRRPPFAGWRIDAPPLSHYPEVTCARRAHLRPDGVLTGKDVTTLGTDHNGHVPRAAYFASAQALPDPGAWSCQAQVSNGSAYAKPRAAVTRPEFVRMRWYGLDDLVLTDARGPTFAIRGQAPEGAQGGRVTLRLTRRICGEKARAGPTVRGRVSKRNRKVSLRFRLPRLRGEETEALYTATTTISGAKAMVGRRIDIDASLDLSLGRHHRSVLAGSLAGCAYA